MLRNVILLTNWSFSMFLNEVLSLNAQEFEDWTESLIIDLSSMKS